MNVYTEYGRPMIFTLIMTDQMKRPIVNTILDATEATPKSYKVKENINKLVAYLFRFQYQRGTILYFCKHACSNQKLHLLT